MSANIVGSENAYLLSLFGRALAQDWIVTPLVMIIVTIAIQDENAVNAMSLKKRKES